MMPQRTFHCHIDPRTKQCIKLKIPEIKCPRPGGCPTWHLPVPVDVYQTKQGTYKSTYCKVHISNKESHVKNFQVHIISKGVHMAHHVGKRTNEKIAVMALPAKNLFAWRPRALHVAPFGEYGILCFVWRQKKMLKLAMFCMSTVRFFHVCDDGF